MPTQTETRKAFEYVLITEANNILSANGLTINVKTDAVHNTAQACYNLFRSAEQIRYTRAAQVAINHIIQLEPRLIFQSNTPDALHLLLQPDNAGQRGDVRDLLFARTAQRWEFGISAKNNHSAAKHSRLSDTIDFGQDWLGLPCSATYFTAVKPLFQALRVLQDQGAVWNAIANKHTAYYVPVLSAFSTELLALNAQHPNVPGLLVSYLLGNNDFYKVIKRARRIEISGYNLHGSLNKARPGSGGRSALKVQQLQLPTQIIQLQMKPGSTNTLILVCDQGWQISFRIHNAETRVVPSLKFDVKLIGQPPNLYTHHLAY